MILLMLIAHLYGVFQLFVLASLTRTVSWRIVLLAFITGIYASTAMSLALQFGWMGVFAAATGQPLRQILPIASYTIDPFIEELVKIVPVLLVCLIPPVRRQIGVADFMIVCAALGSGFGLTEHVFRFSHRTEYAFWSSSDNFWVLPLALDPPAVPGIWRTVSSWLPNGVMTFVMVGIVSAPISQNVHLVWSVVAGLGLGVFVRRTQHRWRAIAVLLVVFVGVDHALNNLAIDAITTNNMVVGALVTPFEWLRHLLPLYPLLALGTATWLDRQDIAGGLTQRQNVWLTAEKQTRFRWLGLWQVALALWNKPRVLWRLWLFVLQRREWALAQAATQGTPDDEHSTALVAVRDAIEQQEIPLKPTRSGLRLSIRDIIALLFALPAFLYFGIGTWPGTGWVQHALGTPVMMWALVGLQAIGLVWLIIQLVAGFARLPRLRFLTNARAVMAAIFGMLTQAAVVVFGVVAVAGTLTGYAAFQPLLGGLHIADSVKQAITYTWHAFTAAGAALVIAGYAFVTARWDVVVTGIPAVYNEPTTRGKVAISAEIITADGEAKRGGQGVEEEAPAPPTSGGDDSNRPPVPPPVAPGPPNESPDEEPEQPKNKPPFRPPNKRHYLRQVKQNSTAKPKNTIIEPRVDVEADVRAINAGQAERVGNTYIVNGRTYGLENGTLYPIAGDGFHLLNRMAYKALGIYNTFGNTARANAILDRMTQLTPADRAAALAVWRLGQ